MEVGSMKVNKINDKQIICNLTERDLCVLGFNKTDFFSGSNKATAFFSALMDTALEQAEVSENCIIKQCIFNYNDQENSCDVLIHMEEIGDDENIDEVEDLEEIEQVDDDLFEEEYQLFKESLEVLLKTEDEENPNFLLAFKSMDEAIDLCRIAMPEAEINSLLLKKDGKYFLVIPKEGLKPEEIISLTYHLADFTEINYISVEGLAHIMEYGEEIIKENAISKLKMI